MIENIDWKLVVGILGGILMVIGYIPYLKDIFAGKTKPHLYTWIIWTLTWGTALVALLYAGGKFGSIVMIVGMILVLWVLGLCFKHGTKNITKSDTVTLILALLAIVAWWQLKDPTISVIMVTAIDGLGYIPTFRKTYQEPYSETMFFWFIMAVVTLLSMLANAEYNFLTMFYLGVVTAANITVAMIILLRRKTLKSATVN